MQTAGPNAPIDTATEMVLRQKPALFWVLFVFFALFMLLMFAPIYMLWGRDGQFRHFADWLALFGGLLFTALALISFKRAVLGRAPVVWLAPEGFSNHTIAPIRVPWREITEISVRHGRGAHLRMTLTDRMAAILRPNRFLRRLQSLNSLSLRPTLHTNSFGLEISLNRLEEITKTYARAHGGSVA